MKGQVPVVIDLVIDQEHGQALDEVYCIDPLRVLCTLFEPANVHVNLQVLPADDCILPLSPRQTW